MLTRVFLKSLFGNILLRKGTYFAETSISRTAPSSSSSILRNLLVESAGCRKLLFCRNALFLRKAPSCGMVHFCANILLREALFLWKARFFADALLRKGPYFAETSSSRTAPSSSSSILRNLLVATADCRKFLFCRKTIFLRKAPSCGMVHFCADILLRKAHFLWKAHFLANVLLRKGTHFVEPTDCEITVDMRPLHVVR